MSVNMGNAVVYLTFTVSWICGIAVAKGFWLTLGSAIFPPMAWVLLAQHLMGV